MPPPKSIFIGLLLTAGILSARGQFTGPSFNLPSFPDSVPISEIVRQTEALPGSIPKARQLLAVAQIYMDEGRSRNLDTSLGYVQEAFALSSAMRDTAVHGQKPPGASEKKCPSLPLRALVAISN